jgi:hypothetical protein
MKIVFICGSLEPGRDGVGDYVRRLSAELIIQGHKSGAIAINDKHVMHKISAFQQAGSYSIPVLRLPATWAESERFEEAEKWISQFDADWLSLQFVPFSFHSKGLPFNLAKRLVTLGRGKSWHLMMHELWVGMNRESQLKYKIWGEVQRYLIKSIIKKITPKIIHTQTNIYQIQLAKLGFQSIHLPLFANISNLGKRKSSKTSMPTKSDVSKDSTFHLVTFGSIHPDAPIEQFAHDVAQYSMQHAISIKLTLIGRCGNEKGRWASAWKDAGLTIEIPGEESPEQISNRLLNASMGVSTTPAALICKSGTAMSMLEHELPVLCVTAPWTSRGISHLEIPAGVYNYTPGEFKPPSAVKLPSSLEASAIAQYLINSLMFVV